MVNSYTDIRKIKHTVEHLTQPPNDDDSKERIIEEILSALTKPKKQLRLQK